MVVGDVEADVRVTEVQGVSVVEITQPETAVVLRRASDQRAVALDFRMRADTQSAHEARVDEKVVVTARLELDQQRNVHIGGEKLRFGEFDPLFDVLVVGNGYALFVLECDVLVEAEVVSSKPRPVIRWILPVAQQDEVDGIDGYTDGFGTLREVFRIVRQREVAEVRDQPVVVDADSGPAAVAPQDAARLLLAFRFLNSMTL